VSPLYKDESAIAKARRTRIVRLKHGLETRVLTFDWLTRNLR